MKFKCSINNQINAQLLVLWLDVCSSYDTVKCVHVLISHLHGRTFVWWLIFYLVLLQAVTTDRINRCTAAAVNWLSPVLWQKIPTQWKCKLQNWITLWTWSTVRKGLNYLEFSVCVWDFTLKQFCSVKTNSTCLLH